MNTSTMWNTQLQIGSDLIDNQHKFLFDLFKDTRIAINSGASIRVIDPLLDVLLHYSLHHFNSEEEYIKSHPGYAEHCLQHYEFIKKLNDYTTNIRNKRLSEEQSSASFLDDLFISHIEEFDKPFLSAKEVAKNLASLTVQVDDFEHEDLHEKRQHQRISHDQVVDGKIFADCYNVTRMQKRKATIIDMSPGGLKMQSSGDHMFGDLLIISCSIGKKFHMKEKVKVVTAKDHNYGVEFINPAEETLQFLTQLYGSVFLNRGTIL